MNFISDDGFDSFFNDLIFDNFSKIKVMYLPYSDDMNSKFDVTGNASFGDSKQNKQPWSIQFKDMQFTHYIVESLDKNKTYVKEYTRDELLGKDELLNDLSEIKKKKGFAIYVKNTVQKREIKNLYINENNLTQYKAKKIYKEL